MYGERRGEGRERSFTRRCKAEKLPWLVVEVEVDAERAGCFAERQVRLSLVCEEAIPEIRDRLGSPVERTKWSQKVLFGADRGDGAAPLSCEVAWWIHGAPARLWVPPDLKSDTLCCKRWPCSLLALSSQKRCFRYHIPIPLAGFYDNGRFIVIWGFRLYHPATCGFHDNGLPATNGTRVRCSWPGFAPNHFAAVVAGQNLFRRMSRSDIARVSIGPFR